MTASQVQAQGAYTPAKVPPGLKAASMTVSLLSLGVISICVARRFHRILDWKNLSLPNWILVLFYLDSGLFIVISTIIKDIGTNESRAMCSFAVFACLIFYMSSKVLLYYFLVEKAHLVQHGHRLRRQDKVYLFNCFGMMLPYVALVVLVIYYRIAFINEEGTCLIGVGRKGLIPLLTFDIVINVYLTILFLIPLRRLYSYRTNTESHLRVVAYRTFIGSCCTLVASVANIVFMTIIEGEPTWLCFILCPSDVLFGVLVLHWVTSVDRNPQNSSTSSVKGSPQRTGGIVRDDPLGSSRSANNTTKVHSNCEAIEMGTFGDDSEKSDVHQIQITRTVDTDDKCDRVSSTGSQEHIIKDYEERRHF